MPARDPRFDILFEPVKIGPVTARNRFYQVPHCNGMGDRYPKGMAAMRGVKAEGGWAVVSTEEVEIDHTTDFSPAIEGRLWDEGDIPYHAHMVDMVHQHGALAAIELCHQGIATANLASREVPMGPSAQSLTKSAPHQARAMDLSDIRTVRESHRASALLARRAGYDIVYVYAGHNLSVAQQFLLRRYNHRTDEYGGSLENRVRFLRELIEDTKDAVGEHCGVAVRIAVDELLGAEGLSAEGETPEIIAMLAELPDLWDVNISDWQHDSQTARFAEEGYQEPFTAFVKGLTTKPVVGVGRYTSPDRMVSLVRKGALDLIGAARPSIADPFLPKKIEEGREDEIRECIGCNICVSGDMTLTPIRCTQNPTMGEEWRRGWHPERIERAVSDGPVLVVGAGPAGLECARALGLRGYPVTLAESTREFGGSARALARLPGMASYQRVVDYRVNALQQMSIVSIYRESALTVKSVMEFDFPTVVLATGSSWRRDAVGPTQRTPLATSHPAILTPDDLFAGSAPTTGEVLVYDDDGYLMGALVAEELIRSGCSVTFMTPDGMVSPWTVNTLEQTAIQRRLLESGVRIMANRRLVALTDPLRHACAYTGAEEDIAPDVVMLVTARTANDALWRALSTAADTRAVPWRKLAVIGDAQAPATVAHAVYAGHKFAREHEADAPQGAPYKRERVALAD
jgi:dimethylamine/trimethylamine dehydrogenase